MTDGFSIDPALAGEIEDTIMFGKPHEIELLLESISEGALPQDVRKGLESLHYFRTHYGSRPLDETDKKKAVLMDSAWAMELLNTIRARIRAAAKRA